MNAIEIRIKNSADLGDRLKKAVMKNERFKPIEVGCDSDRAFSTEFGSDGITPSPNAKRTFRGRGEDRVPSSDEMEIRRALERRGYTGKRLDEMAKKIHGQRVRFGDIPHPFIRPAVYGVITELNHTQIPGGISSKAIGEMVVKRARLILESDGILFADELARNLYSKPAGDDAGHLGQRSDISREAMENPQTDAHGVMRGRPTYNQGDGN